MKLHKCSNKEIIIILKLASMSITQFFQVVNEARREEASRDNSLAYDKALDMVEDILNGS